MGLRKIWKSITVMGAASLATLGTLAGYASTAQAASTTLKVEIFDRGNSPSGYTATNNYWTQWLQQNFGKPSGINLQYVAVPRSQEVPQLNVFMASGNNIPDIMFTYDVGTVYKFAQEGGLTDLGPLIDKYAPHLKKYLGEATLESGQFNGIQYTIPAKRVWLGKYSTYIRQDWLNKLHLPAPTNTTQLYHDLLAFKQHKMGGKTTIPLGMALIQSSYSSVIWSFIDTKIPDKDRFINTEPNHNLPVLLPGFKNALHYLNKLYNAGLISPDVALDKDGTQLQQDVMNGEVGVFSWDDIGPFGANPGVNAVMKKNSPGAQLAAIKPWTQETMYLPNGMYIFVPKSSQNAVAAVKYLDFLAQSKNMDTIAFGYKGKTYKMIDGIPVIMQNAQSQKMLYNSGDVNVVTNGIDFGSLRKNERAMVLGNPGNSQKDQAVEMKALQFETTRDVQLLHLPHPITSDAQYGDTLQSLEQQMIVKCMEASPKDFNSVYNSLLQNYKASGGTQVQAQMRQVWNAMNAKERQMTIAQMNLTGFN